MGKKNENKWMQIGNYLLGHEKNSLGLVLCVRAISGQWSIRWSEDTMVYAVVTRLMADKNCHKYVEALLTIYFSATMYPHDFVAFAETQKTPFIDGFCKLMNEQTALEVSLSEPGTVEQDEQALKDIGQLQEIQEELEKLDEAEHGGN